jgi:hypothetical protein
VHEVLESAEGGAGGEVVVSTNTVISNYLLKLDSLIQLEMG